MFYMERTPRILSQQTDLTLAQIAEAFPIATIHPGNIPGLPADWPAKLQDSIDHNQALAKDLLPEVRTTLDSANQLTLSLNGTVKSVQELTAQAPPLPALTAEDISQNLKELNAALDHLNATVAGVNQLLEKGPDGNSKALELSQVVNKQADHLMDLAFYHALILLSVFFGGVILTLFMARAIFSRKQPTS